MCTFLISEFHSVHEVDEESRSDSLRAFSKLFSRTHNALSDVVRCRCQCLGVTVLRYSTRWRNATAPPHKHPPIAFGVAGRPAGRRRQPPPCGLAFPGGGAGPGASRFLNLNPGIARSVGVGLPSATTVPLSGPDRRGAGPKAPSRAESELASLKSGT